ncbi:hypothetical protein GCM10007358_16580 [Phocicoccus schoeneichii]|uniref:EcoKI restriction-modification system protein HsdS n=1 Tax=Phocicoccus schoeneichii TaxID=1812261 RepID=A0A6V7RN57_9BACL|nr:restriction endonuclease subunit S [Jeotgalicoccus schoeneichii]GGH55319.1 hypothetical protein GCM10007358_16580 [Jeotgalicoccus schoeneichii]CAD2079762.1 EcoKI restriction-modification system protein HsdS [Jeotgalicoccus schoeneichii]
MSKEKLVPKLRFEGFENNEWIPYKLKNIVRFSKGRGYSKNDLLEQGSPIILYGRMYTNYEIIIRDVDTYAKPKENTIYSKGTEVIVPSSGETAEDIARASFVSKKGIILGGDLNIMHLIENHNPLFLALSISNDDRKKELIRRAQGSSVVHLYNTDLENAVVYFPTLTEQNKISSYLEKIDKMIQLQQSKVNKVKDLKSAYLSEMFPKEGEKYPKKRFEGFTEPWEEYKLKDMGRSLTGLSGKSKKDFGHGEAEFVTYMNVFDNPIAKSTQTAQVEVDENQTEVEYGDIFFTVSSETPNEVGMSSVWLYNRPNVYLNSFCFGFRPTINLNPYYMAYMLRSPEIRKRFILLAQGISRYNISKTKAMELLFPIPSNEEQEKIGQFFKNLDNQISIEEKKLAKLENLKQGYLNDMFV